MRTTEQTGRPRCGPTRCRSGCSTVARCGPWRTVNPPARVNSVREATAGWSHTGLREKNAIFSAVAALTDRVLRCGAGRRGRWGSPDPQLLVVLDEAANICWTADLPTLYSHLGSRGIVPVTIL